MESAKEHSNDAYRDLPDKSFHPLIRGICIKNFPRCQRKLERTIGRVSTADGGIESFFSRAKGFAQRFG